MSFKQDKKKRIGKCLLCGEKDYNLLDVHRWHTEGGKYNEFNTFVCCANCHRKIHSNNIKILNKYTSTKGPIFSIVNEQGNNILISEWD